ncbi:MAG: MFS transporter [Deltaproteobacteria bacterium]|nr:MFS transporter [Deltaproteobacteria bacterium]
MTTAYPSYRWYVLITLVVAHLMQGMALIGPTPLIGLIADTLNTNLGSATAASMLPFTLMVAIGGLISGFVIDRWGLAKTYILFCSIETLAAVLIFIWGTSIAGLSILRGLQGLGCGPITASGPKLAAEWFPVNQRSMVQGFAGAALSAGIILGLNLSPVIADLKSWVDSLTILGGLMIVAVILSIIFLYGTKFPISTEYQTMENAALKDFNKVFRLPAFWMTFLSVFALAWVMQGYQDLIPGRIAVSPPAGLGFGTIISGRMMGLLVFAFMLGSLVSPIMAEKIFHGRYGRAVTVSFSLTAVFCLSIMLPAVTSRMPSLAICLFLAGFFMGMPNAMNMSFIANTYPEHITGSIGGFTMGLGIFGGAIGVAAGSAALHITGMYHVSIIIVAIAAIIGAISGLGIKPPQLFRLNALHSSTRS